MSGPKSSRYSMTLRHRQMLQEQLSRVREAQIIEKRKQSEIDVIRRNCLQLKESVSKLEDLVKQSEWYSNEGHKGTMDINAIHILCNEVLSEINEAENVGTNKSLEQIKEIGQTITSQTERIQIELQKVELNLEQQESRFRDDTMKTIGYGFGLSFANIGDKKALNNSVYFSRIQEELDKLTKYTLSDELMKEYEEIRKKADNIKSADFLENFYSISIIPYVKKCKEYDCLNMQFGEDYKMLCLRYEYMAKELNHDIERIPFSEHAVQLLLEKISALEEEELKTKEESYICQCIEETMTEMHYSVIGSRDVTKKNGKHFRNVLYKFDEGAAVNVTYSSDGQVTMELGGIDSKDRMPTDEESTSLEEDMRSFCNDYYEIEKKLKARGIEPKHISHLPADAQFAQIINVSDFDMNEDIGTYNARKGRNKNSGAVGAKLHREG